MPNGSQEFTLDIELTWNSSKTPAKYEVNQNIICFQLSPLVTNIHFFLLAQCVY